MTAYRFDGYEKIYVIESAISKSLKFSDKQVCVYFFRENVATVDKTFFEENLDVVELFLNIDKKEIFKRIENKKIHLI